jgi:hypothetical protein
MVSETKWLLKATREHSHVFNLPIKHEKGIIASDGYRMHVVGEFPDKSLKIFESDTPSFWEAIPKTKSISEVMIDNLTIKERFNDFKIYAKHRSNIVKLSIKDRELIGNIDEITFSLGFVQIIKGTEKDFDVWINFSFLFDAVNINKIKQSMIETRLNDEVIVIKTSAYTSYIMPIRRG